MITFLGLCNIDIPSPVEQKGLSFELFSLLDLTPTDRVIPACILLDHPAVEISKAAIDDRCTCGLLVVIDVLEPFNLGIMLPCEEIRNILLGLAQNVDGKDTALIDHLECARICDSTEQDEHGVQ